MFMMFMVSMQSFPSTAESDHGTQLQLVITIHSVENMNVCTKVHDNPSKSCGDISPYWDISLNQKCQPAGGTRWKAGGTAKLSWLILWKPWMSVPNVTVIPQLSRHFIQNQKCQFHSGASGRLSWSLKTVGFILWGKHVNSSNICYYMSKYLSLNPTASMVKRCFLVMTLMYLYLRITDFGTSWSVTVDFITQYFPSALTY